MDTPKRKNNRLQHYDYSAQGGYYITICMHERKKILSQVVFREGEDTPSLKLTELGELIDQILRGMGSYKGMRADAWIIMPDHIHLIVMKEESSSESVGRFVGAFKSIVSNEWCSICDKRGIRVGKLWQRNYYDHILRSEADYIEKTQYMENNPIRWYKNNMR